MSKWRVTSWGYEEATITDGTTEITVKDNAYQRPLDQGGRPRQLAIKVAAALNQAASSAPAQPVREWQPDPPDDETSTI